MLESDAVDCSRRVFVGAGLVALGGEVASAGVGSGAVRMAAVGAGELRKAFVDGTGHGWVELGEEHFTNVNCHDDTWTWEVGGRDARPTGEGVVLHCTGQPVGVLRSVKPYTNFEMVCEWCHRKPAGNSGVFVWTTEESLAALAEAGKPGLPKGIEVQVLDLAYGGDTPADWYTSHGDVFPVGVEMTPFAPTSPNGVRSFPSKNLSKGAGEWNHYYIRAINGEVRLWVNGEEVSGGTGCEPRSGYLALESEGSPIDFRNLRLRELA